MSDSRLLAIGDIHGCRRAFDTLLAAVQPTADDWLVALGDYVDRGPDSRGVLERLIALDQDGRLVALAGNHEQMMLAARRGMDEFLMWQRYGGQATLDSYGADEAALGFGAVPPEHWRFLETRLRDWFETDAHVFVHAGLRPHLDFDQQPEEALRWEKLVNPLPHRSGKVVVCGHTPQTSGWPLLLGHTICLDTFVYGDGGWLTCLDVGSYRFWQANQQGQLRTGQLKGAAWI